MVVSAAIHNNWRCRIVVPEICFPKTCLRITDLGSLGGGFTYLTTPEWVETFVEASCSQLASFAGPITPKAIWRGRGVR